ncbi:D-alanyl-D-alanine carboxypeptidase family protein [Streptomyces sp. NPDC002185]|uniref:D-alanyl-D-alanine carboxypeptidase family protein n=1 Tax=Streptomyces sp. NPDC002185 TaxID=3364636 RepID=UPI0036A2B71E
MAGESPDRAEQQGSSQETAASGGGGRDPRLSVLRESESATSSAVRVDQPTAVFKTLAPRTPEDDEPAAEKSAAETTAAAEKPAAEKSGAGEAPVADEAAADAADAAEPEVAAEPEGDRLKAAVAAWVATAEEPEESGKGAEASAGGSEGRDEPEPEADDEADDAEGADEPRDDEPEADEAGDESDDDSEAEAGDVSEGEPEGEPVEDKAASASWFAARKPAADEKPATPSGEVSGGSAEDAAEDASDDSATGSSESPAKGAAKDSATGSAEDSSPDDEPDDEPVDQPTTMFKMVRPPVVDQPTTALKLPSTPAADSDSERTSVFRALRPDIPAEQKAEKAENAARTAQEAAKAPAAPAPGSKAPAPAPVASPAPAGLAEAERTRQQPLPPLPPLDLLAELTNTPPPPPTPLRTTVRRLRIWTPLVLLLLIVFAIAQMVRPLPAPALTLSAAPTFTFGGGKLAMPWPGEGQGAVEVEGVGSMGLYGAQKPAPIASVTKTMTAYVILRDHPIKGKQQGPEITIDKKAADQAGATHESTAQVKEGQTYTEKELLQLLMIPSANNVARLLARWDAGSEAAFVEKMNAAAKELGMTRSTYTDPSGLLDSTMSTPQDQLKLAKAVMQYDVFREIVNMPNLTVDGIPGRIENNNTILLEDGVNGIKTGSSTPAGGNLLWSANTVVDGKNRRVLGIVMGAKNAKILNDKLDLAISYSLKLIQQAQKDVTSAAVVKKGQLLGYVDDGLGGRTPVVATKELKAVGWPGLKVELELTDGGKAVPHSGKAGDIVGQVSIGTGAGKVSSPVALSADLVEPGFDKKLTRVG